MGGNTYFMSEQLNLGISLAWNPCMPLSAADWTLLNAVILRLYRELETERHRQVLLEVIHELVPAELVALNVFEVATQDYQVISIPANYLRPSDMTRVAGLLNQSPFPAYYLATGDPLWKMVTDFMPMEDFRATDLWKEGLNPLAIDHQLCGMLAVENGVVHGLTLNRSHRPFDERERELLNTLHPHLVTSYLNAMAFARAQSSVEELRAVVEASPGAYACLRPDGSLAWMQERAREWLAEFHAEEAFADNGLPVRIEHLRLMQQGENKVLHAEKTVHAEVLFACLSPSPMGGSILRLQRRACEPAVRFIAQPGLSERENEVLRWMIEGKRNREIATILGISVRTVEKHVEAVLTTLSAENRATAIVRAIERMASAFMP